MVAPTGGWPADETVTVSTCWSHLCDTSGLVHLYDERPIAGCASTHGCGSVNGCKLASQIALADRC